MPAKSVPPSISLKAFSCPRCGALADQRWHETYAREVRDKGIPSPIDPEFLSEVKKIANESRPDERSEWDRRVDYFERMITGDIFLWEKKASEYCRYEIGNMYVSSCFSCKGITIWHHDKILHPRHLHEVDPNVDLDEEIKVDFNEARAIIDVSPRGAAALLRLCLQKLCKQLGLKGENINDDIGNLVSDGLPVRIQKALDIVRVIGNDAVHPGQVDLRDNRETALKLFDLINLIAHNRLTEPKEVDALYESLPESKRQAIAARDKKE